MRLILQYSVLLSFIGYHRAKLICPRPRSTLLYSNAVNFKQTKFCSRSYVFLYIFLLKFALHQILVQIHIQARV